MKSIFTLCFFSLVISVKSQVCYPNSSSLHFNGHSSYVALTTSNDLNITNKITVEAWIKAEHWAPYTAFGSIVCKHGWSAGEEGYVLRAGGQGQLSFNIAGIDDHGQFAGWQEVLSNPNALQLNTWYHVAGTYDGNKLKLYINGQEVQSENFKGSIAPATHYKLKIGRIGDTGASNGRFWWGAIDEVRIWNKNISKADINDNRNQHVSAGSPNLVGYWRFNENSGNTCNDLGDGNNDATLYNTTWNADVPFTNGITRPQISQSGNDLVSNSLYGNQWNLNGIPIQGETGIRITPQTGGQYSVTVSYGLSCTATSNAFSYTILSTENILGNDFFIGPNPCEGKLRIISPSHVKVENLKVFDCRGRILAFKNGSDLSNELDLSAFSPGIYFVSVEIKDAVYNRRIVLK